MVDEYDPTDYAKAQQAIQMLISFLLGLHDPQFHLHEAIRVLAQEYLNNMTVRNETTDCLQ